MKQILSAAIIAILPATAIGAGIVPTDLSGTTTAEVSSGLRLISSKTGSAPQDGIIWMDYGEGSSVKGNGATKTPAKDSILWEDYGEGSGVKDKE